MKILILGSGAREHALGWKLAQENDVFATPGNPGIAQVATVLEGSLTDPQALLRLCREHHFDLVIVGPEDPLIAGVADVLRQDGHTVFGPGASGARLEGSKAFSKDLMRTAGIPTAEGKSYDRFDEAIAASRQMFASGHRVVVKASGAALGKGVVVCDAADEAEDALHHMMIENAFGEAGTTVVIERRLTGPEFSLISLCAGDRYWSLPVAQDHKRALDGDRGPNTGGMGTYSPVPWISEELVQRTEAEVVAPALAALRKQGVDFRGVLFSGLLLEGGQPYCLEFNVRFGDPEIQSLVMRIGSGLGEALLACAQGEVPPALEVKNNAAVSVVLASAGYPGAYPKGLQISISELPEGVTVFHAGTAYQNGKLVTSGGRVLTVTGVGRDLHSARSLAYRAANLIHFDGKHMRTDIGALA